MESEGSGLVGRRLRLAVLSVSTLALVWACGLAPVTPVSDPTPANVGLSPVPTGTPIPTVPPELEIAQAPTQATVVVIAPSASTDLTNPAPALHCAVHEASMSDPYKGDALRSLAEFHPEVYCEIVKNPWLRDPDNDPHHVEPLVLRFLNTLAFRDKAAAYKAVQLPFLDTIEWGDSDIVQFMVDLTWSDPEGLASLLNHESVTGVNQKTHIPLVYLQSVDPGAAAELSALDWVEDGLYLHEHEGLTLLQKLARVSKRTFRHFLDSDRAWLPPQTGMDDSALERLVEIAAINEDAVILIADMPFMDTIEWVDHQTLTRFLDLAKNDLDTLNYILDNHSGGGGITNEQAIYVLILDLEETAPDIAAAINAMAWVQDGLTYVPPRNSGSINPDPEEFERSIILDMLTLADRAPDFLLELTRKPWMLDDLTNPDVQIFFDLQDIHYRDPEGAIRILRLPFMDSVGPEEETIVDRLAELLRTNRDQQGFEEAISDLASAGTTPSDS